MAHIHYFTDGSVIQSQYRVQELGSFGFVELDKGCRIMNGYVGFSRPDIHYLESLAIYYVLLNMQSRGSTDNKFTIYTDSNSCYNRIKEYMIEPHDSIDWIRHQDLFSKQTLITCDLAYRLFSEGYDLLFLCIKSHCHDGSEQKKFLRKSGIRIDEKYARFINKGNTLADKLVYNTTLFQKAYSSVPVYSLT